MLGHRGKLVWDTYQLVNLQVPYNIGPRPSIGTTLKAEIRQRLGKGSLNKISIWMGAHDHTSVRRRSLPSQTELSGLLSIGSYGSSVCRYYRKCRHLARMEWHWIFHANVTGSSKLVISKGLFYSHLFDCIRRQFREIHRVLYNIGRLLTQRALARHSITSLWRKTKNI